MGLVGGVEVYNLVVWLDELGPMVEYRRWLARLLPPSMEPGCCGRRTGVEVKLTSGLSEEFSATPRVNLR